MIKQHQRNVLSNSFNLRRFGTLSTDSKKLQAPSTTEQLAFFTKILGTESLEPQVIYELPLALDRISVRKEITCLTMLAGLFSVRTVTTYLAPPKAKEVRFSVV